MGALAHPSGMNFSASDVNNMTASEINFWIGQMNRINKASNG
jgi:hypothetical protein